MALAASIQAVLLLTDDRYLLLTYEATGTLILRKISLSLGLSAAQNAIQLRLLKLNIQLFRA